MLTREQMVRAIEQLPDDATVDDAFEALMLLEKIERGLAQAEAGQVVSQEDARRRLARWLK